MKECLGIYNVHVRISKPKKAQEQDWDAALLWQKN